MDTINVVALASQLTHHDGAEDSTIDYICVSSKNRVLSFEKVHLPSIAKHDFLLATLPLSALTYIHVTVLHLSSVDWSHISDFHDVDDEVSFFSQIF